MKAEYTALKNYLDAAQRIVVLQSERVDTDSLGCALALEHFLAESGKQVTLFAAAPVPGYLKHLNGWDRVTDELPADFDLTILVDGASLHQLERTWAAHQGALAKRPFIIIDHHSSTTGEIPIATLKLIEPAGACGEQILRIANKFGWPLNPEVAYFLGASIRVDTAGLTSPGVGADTFRAMAQLVEAGFSPEQLRINIDKYGAMPVDQLPLKVQALDRTRFFHQNQIAATYFTAEEYESLGGDRAVIEKMKLELRFLQGVDVSVVITERQGYTNASMRANLPVARVVAEQFGGGGHDMAASCRFENADHKTVIDKIIPVISEQLDKLSKD